MALNQPTERLTEQNIKKLMGSPAYHTATHPDYLRTRNKVADWHAYQYGIAPVRTDATGKMVKPTSKADYFITQIEKGMTLFVGEGNFSFVLSIARQPGIIARNIVATVLEKEKDLSDFAKENASLLKQLGTAVDYGIDATNLEKFYLGKFDTVVFQFPNVGSREPIRGRNPNFVLIRSFLKSAAQCLQPYGKVIISAVDSPHYQGAFQFEEAAKRAGFEPPVEYPFDPEKFASYNHTNTNDEDSALEKHDEFKTWVFALKDDDRPKQ